MDNWLFMGVCAVALVGLIVLWFFLRSKGQGDGQ
jgi:hypothetical protein